MKAEEPKHPCKSNTVQQKNKKNKRYTDRKNSLRPIKTFKKQNDERFIKTWILPQATKDLIFQGKFHYSLIKH